MIVLLQIIYQVAITSLTYSWIPANKKGAAACFVVRLHIFAESKQFNCRCFKDHCAHAHAGCSTVAKVSMQSMRHLGQQKPNLPISAEPWILVAWGNHLIKTGRIINGWYMCVFTMCQAGSSLCLFFFRTRHCALISINNIIMFYNFA